jgi:hypothetical protein
MLVQEENVQKDAQMVQNQIFQKIASWVEQSSEFDLEEWMVNAIICHKVGIFMLKKTFPNFYSPLHHECINDFSIFTLFI